MNWMEKAAAWDEKNPQFYELFKRFAFEAIKAGKKRYAADLIFGAIRWHMSINTVGDDYKINQNFRLYYVEKFMRDFPQHTGFFRTRRRAAA